MILTDKGTTYPTHRRTMLLVIAAVALVAAFAMTMQYKALQGAITGYNASTSEHIRMMDTLEYHAQCPACLKQYDICTSPARTRKDFSAARRDGIMKKCAAAFAECHGQNQCFR